MEQTKYTFHFKGVYAGFYVSKVILYSPTEDLFKENLEYIVLVRVDRVDQNILYGLPLKSKKLMDVEFL